MTIHEGIPIFLVIGSTGEFEDYHEWIVCAYRDIDSAHDHAKKANEEAKEILNKREKSIINTIHQAKYDNGMIIDYTGTDYFVEETILHINFKTLFQS